MARFAEIVEKLAAEGVPVSFINRPWRGYADQKQFALDACRQDWCLNLDIADRIDAELANEIGRIVQVGSPHAAFALTRRERLPGYGYVHPWASQAKIIRLIGRGGIAGAHASEQADFEPDFEIANTGSINDLHQALAAAI